jgi:hypothetical protein
MFSKMNELAEKKAQLQLELLEEAKLEAKNEEDGSSKKKSLTDSLIEGILPVVTQALAMQQNPALAMQQNQLAMRQQAIQRRQLQIAQARRAKANGQVQPRSRAEEITNAVRNEKVQTFTNEQNKKSVLSGGTDTRVDIVKNNGLPSIAIGENVLDIYLEPLDLTIKEKCEKLLPEFLGNLMLENVSAEEGAERTLEMLKENGISREEFLKEVQIQTILEEAEKYGLPDVAYEWLNEMYAHIQSKSGDAIRRESSTSDQPTA